MFMACRVKSRTGRSRPYTAPCFSARQNAWSFLGLAHLARWCYGIGLLEEAAFLWRGGRFVISAANGRG